MKACVVRDFLYEASSEELYQKFYKDIDIRTYKMIVSNDPTSTDRKNGKYCKWLLDLYRKFKGNNQDTGESNEQKVFKEDLYKIKESLKLFNRYGNRVEKKQIQQYTDYKDLIVSMEPFEKTEEVENKYKTELDNIKNIQTDRIYEDSEWLIVRPKTKKSSCFWGQGTKWCTAAKGDANRFSGYNSRGPLYIFIDKINKDLEGRQVKYQFHFQSNSFMDAKDRMIQTKLSFNENLINTIIEKSDIKKYPTAFIEFLTLCEREDKILNYILDNKLSTIAVRWSKNDLSEDIMLKLRDIILDVRNAKDAMDWVFIHDRDIEEMREIILNSNDYEVINKWCKNFKEDKDIGRNLILKHGTGRNAYNWCNLQREQSPEFDQKIIDSKDVALMYSWYKQTYNIKVLNAINDMVSSVKTSGDALCKLMYDPNIVNKSKYLNLIKKDTNMIDIYKKIKDNKFEESDNDYTKNKIPNGVRSVIVYLYYLKNDVKFIESITRVLKYINYGKLSDDSTFSTGYWGTNLRTMQEKNLIVKKNNKIHVTPVGYLKLKKYLNNPAIVKFLLDTNILQTLNIPMFKKGNRNK